MHHDHLPFAFALNPLDRSSVETDEGALERALADPDSLGLVLAGEDPVLLGGPDGSTVLASLLSPLGQAAATAPRQRAFLGLLDGRPVVATQVVPATLGSVLDGEGLRSLDLRSVAMQGLVPDAELGMLAQAKSLFGWHDGHGFCSRCGGRTRPSRSHLRRDCDTCGGQHFPRTDPVVIMLVTRGDACLLGRQPRFVPGMYSCLAGFVSQGETLESSVRREVLEEAGIAVGRVRYLASQPWPFPSSLMIGCAGDALTDAITIDRDELEDGRWFARDEVALMLARRHPDGLSAPFPFAIAHQLLRGWVDGTYPG